MNYPHLNSNKDNGSFTFRRPRFTKSRALLLLKDIGALIFEYGYKFNIRLAESENELACSTKFGSVQLTKNSTDMP